MIEMHQPEPTASLPAIPEGVEAVIHSVKDKDYGTEVSLKSAAGLPLLEIAGSGLETPLRLELSPEQFEALSKIVRSESKEIEKRYRLPEFPAEIAASGERCHYRQDYLAIAQDGAEVRVRAIDDETFKITFKVGSGLSRGEAETKLGREQYEALLPHGNGTMEKDHYAVPSSLFTPASGIHPFEFMHHQPPLEELHVLEVETLDAALASEIDRAVKERFPGAVDITEDKSYKAATLVRKGLPEI